MLEGEVPQCIDAMRDEGEEHSHFELPWLSLVGGERMMIDLVGATMVCSEIRNFLPY